MIDFASALVNWRRRHDLNERDAAAILGVSLVAIIQWEKPGFPPPPDFERKVLERMDRWNKNKER